MSVLQQHVAFFDRDDNGIIYPWETYSGMHAKLYHIAASISLLRPAALVPVACYILLAPAKLIRETLQTMQDAVRLGST